MHAHFAYSSAPIFKLMLVTILFLLSDSPTKSRSRHLAMFSVVLVGALILGAHGTEAKVSKRGSAGCHPAAGTYQCEGLILRFTDDKFEELPRQDVFIISNEINGDTKLSDKNFILTRQHEPPRPNDPALCTLKPWEKRSAVCAETADSEISELKFSKDCSSFDIVIYSARSTLEGEYPLVKNEHCQIQE